MRRLEVCTGSGTGWGLGWASGTLLWILNIFVLLIHCDVITTAVSNQFADVCEHYYLDRLAGRCGEGLVRICSRCKIAFTGGWGLVGNVGATKADFEVLSAYFSSRSPMFVFRNAIGIRLTRISIRVRSPCACSIYCARSFLARSVTVPTSTNETLDKERAKSHDLLTLKLQVIDQGLLLTSRDLHWHFPYGTSICRCSCRTS